MKSFMPYLQTASCCVLLLGSAVHPAQAQVAPQASSVYRCGDSYSQQPCPGGHTVAVDDPRSPEQRQTALQAQARDRALAQDMERTRRADEASALAQQKAALAAAKGQPGKAATGSASRGDQRKAGAPDSGLFSARTGPVHKKGKTTKRTARKQRQPG